MITTGTSNRKDFGLHSLKCLNDKRGIFGEAGDCGSTLQLSLVVGVLPKGTNGGRT